MTGRTQLIMVALVLVCLATVGLNVRRRQMRAKYLILWSSLLVGVLPLVLVPRLLDRLSKWIGVYYPPATLFLAAALVLFLINVHFSREISRLEERTRILAEELALSRLEGATGTLRQDAEDAAEKAAGT